MKDWQAFFIGAWLAMIAGHNFSGTVLLLAVVYMVARYGFDD